jgi:TfoX/Sxy family transcriptional regulator of competence genes
MYSYFTNDNFLALKLPEAERVKFLTQYNTTLVHQYGIIQKEYVTVPDSLLENTDELLPWFAISYAYTGALKPKATSKGKNKT